MPELKTGTVIVTGASRGIGASISVELARIGLNVACLSRSGDSPDTGALDTESRRRLSTFRCDITNSASIVSALEAVTQAFRPPVIGLVNNAGIHLQGPSATFPIADFERVMQTNASSVLLVSQIAYPILREAGSALIVNIGSFYDKLGVRGNAAYCASKAAVGAISRCLAVEWARDGIQVINIAPGYIETDLNRQDLNEGALQAFLRKRIPVGGPGRSEDVGRLAAMLFQLPGGFLTGETLYVDGGQGMAL